MSDAPHLVKLSPLAELLDSLPAGDTFGLPGSVFADYLRLLINFQAADKRLHTAQINGDVAARYKAELDRDDALTAVHEFECNGANILLMFMRFATRHYPGALQAYLDPIFRSELDVTQDTVREQSERIDELEEAVAALATGEVLS